MRQFIKLVEDQFKYGGKKYAHNNEKEATDIIFDIFGKNWLFGTCMKYLFRYSNLQRERDLLKIACYCYIIWLKRGFHLNKKGSKKIIDTNIEIKEKKFDIFVNIVNNYFLGYYKQPLEVASKILTRWSDKPFNEVTEQEIAELFLCMYSEWKENYENVETHDTDTWNEKRKG